MEGMTPTQAAMVARCWTNLRLSARLPAPSLDALCWEFGIFRNAGESDESLKHRLWLLLPVNIAIEDLLGFPLPRFVPPGGRW